MNVSEVSGIWSPYHNPRMRHLNIFPPKMMGFDQLNIEDGTKKIPHKLQLFQIAATIYLGLLRPAAPK